MDAGDARCICMGLGGQHTHRAPMAALPRDGHADSVPRARSIIGPIPGDPELCVVTVQASDAVNLKLCQTLFIPKASAARHTPGRY